MNKQDIGKFFQQLINFLYYMQLFQNIFPRKKGECMYALLILAKPSIAYRHSLLWYQKMKGGIHGKSMRVMQSIHVWKLEVVCANTRWTNTLFWLFSGYTAGLHAQSFFICFIYRRVGWYVEKQLWYIYYWIIITFECIALRWWYSIVFWPREKTSGITKYFIWNGDLL